jgi:hypothetical protein
MRSFIEKVVNKSVTVIYSIQYICERNSNLFSSGINQSRKLKSRYEARNRFQEPTLELSSQATKAGGPVRQPYAYLVPRNPSPHSGTYYRHWLWKILLGIWGCPPLSSRATGLADKRVAVEVSLSIVVVIELPSKRIKVEARLLSIHSWAHWYAAQGMRVEATSYISQTKAYWPRLTRGWGRGQAL